MKGSKLFKSLLRLPEIRSLAQASLLTSVPQQRHTKKEKLFKFLVCFQNHYLDNTRKELISYREGRRNLSIQVSFKSI